ncbi:hypothetical protein [Alteribacillus sp. HJP-4]
MLTDQSGMDFTVVFGRDQEGSKWVLRSPRRGVVLERAEAEYRALKLIRY